MGGGAVSTAAVAEKTEAAKSSSKVNYVTKKDAQTVATGGCASADSKVGTNCAGAAPVTITTRGASVKQTLAVNDSAIAAPPHDLSHAHTAPASEEVINTRRKTRSIAANLNGT